MGGGEVVGLVVFVSERCSLGWRKVHGCDMGWGGDLGSRWRFAFTRLDFKSVLHSLVSIYDSDSRPQRSVLI